MWRRSAEPCFVAPRRFVADQPPTSIDVIVDASKRVFGQRMLGRVCDKRIERLREPMPETP